MVRSLPSLLRAAVRTVAVVVLLVVAYSVPAWSTLSQYTFQVASGSATDMSGSTTIYGAGYDDYNSGSISIGFNFNFDGTTFTTFAISTNGYMFLGSSPTTSYANCYTTIFAAPRLQIFEWDMVTQGNGVRYILKGSPGSQILTVEWDVRPYSGSGAGTAQIRLYEGSNNIEYYYNTSTLSNSAYIGMNNNANSSYVGVVNGSASGSATCSTVSFPSSGTIYRFVGCGTTVAGNVAQGGTSQMNTGDALLTNISTTVGTFVNATPFSLSQSGPACGAGGGTVTYAISGPSASEYTITPTSGSVPSTPTIKFTPTGPGVRNAQLTVTAGSFVRVYGLAATGIQRIVLSGNVAQGGTNPIVNGDTLFRNTFVNVGQCQSFQPITLTNVSASNANFSASITNNASGQYQMVPISGVINPGGTYTLPISFCPTDTGRRMATLNITADGVTTTYLLWAFGAYPKALFAVNGNAVDSTSELFNMQFGCVGEEFITIPLDVSAAGGKPVTITGIQAYEVDTTVRQGSPSYALRQDQFGNFIPAGDYILTTTPPSLPFTSATALQFPYVVPPGTTRLYLSFIASRPGKRFARVYLTTDAVNLLTMNEYGGMFQGLLRFDVYGRGRAAMLADGGSLVQRPQAIDLGTVRLGDRITKWIPFSNRGECSMSIDTRYLQTDVGDVNEIKLEAYSTTFPISADSTKLLLAPGMTDSVLVSFAPKQIGTRHAGLYLRTNDSALGTPGTPEHGVYRIDLRGTGASGLYLTMEGANLGTGVIGAASGPYAHGVVRMINNSGAPITVTSLTMSGMDSADFVAAPAWPTTSFDIAPGQIIELGVDFVPTAGTPGTRQTTVAAVTSTGQTISAPITAEAGSKMLTVNPTSVNFPTAKAGRVVRQTVMVQNTGTMPITITNVAISGTNAADFQFAPLVRTELAPNQAEFIEVSFKVAVAGSSTASLDITSTASATPVQVALNATATVNRYSGDDDPAGATIGAAGKDRPSEGDVEFGVAGVGAEQKGTVNVVPNPSRGGEVEVAYAVPGVQTVEVVMVDGAGRVVGTQRVAGAQGSVKVSTAGLAAGIYTVQVRSTTGVVSQRLVVLP